MLKITRTEQEQNRTSIIVQKNYQCILKTIMNANNNFYEC